MGKEKKHCNQCGRLMFYHVFEQLNGLGNPYVCNNPECPNYSLLQMAVEDMPKSEKPK